MSHMPCNYESLAIVLFFGRSIECVEYADHSLFIHDDISTTYLMKQSRRYIYMGDLFVSFSEHSVTAFRIATLLTTTSHEPWLMAFSDRDKAGLIFRR